jgi:cyclomaltodextrinase
MTMKLLSKNLKYISYVLIMSLFIGCTNEKPVDKKPEQAEASISDNFQPKEYVELKHPEWSKNATIYEVNLRQYTKEGTFKAFENHLPRLKEMGVDIIWLMPIHPIGVKNRKGTLGSYYSVQDYYGVNPEFGNLEDFKSLVTKIHSMGMYVILDWVANHSAWDNPLVTEHPEWYIKTKEGNFQPTPWRDYDDIIDFDFTQPGIREYMTNALKYWINETNIDGYRCDVASFVPIEFWENTRLQLAKIKPVFMLAEAADRDLHKNAFDTTYSWSLWENLHNIISKNYGIHVLTEGYIAEHVSIWPRNGFRMNFIDNHDKNSWEGNQFSNFGDGLNAAIVLSVTIEGIPMMYSGQETGLNRSLNFFEKDPIEWKKHEIGTIYSKLFNLKHKNKALWNGDWGGEMRRIKNDKMDKIISFSREKENDKIITIVNLNKESCSVKFDTKFYKGNYTELFSEKKYTLTGNDKFEMNSWSYLVLIKNN